MDYPLISVIIALIILAFALVINKFLIDVFEEDKPFLRLIAVFLGIFILGVIVVSYLNPTSNAFAHATQERQLETDY